MTDENEIKQTLDLIEAKLEAITELINSIRKELR